MWDWAVWAALIVGGAAILGALALAAVRALQAWRDFKRARRHLFKALDSLAEAGERTADTVASLGETEELQASAARLRRSLAQLAILRSALDEARSTLGWLGVVLPRS